MKKQIDTLTDAQKAKMPEYVKKWVDIGSNTDRLDYDTTVKTVQNFRGLIGRATDTPVIILDNPIECWAACCLVKMDVPIENVVEELATIFNGNPKKYEIPKPNVAWCSGSFSAATFSFYDYMIEEVGVEVEAELWAKYKVWEATSKLGYVYPLEEVTFVSQKPSEIHLNDDNVLHRDGGPALVYAGYGNFNIYSLNGVQVPQWLAETPAEDIDIERYNEITNADVRAEFVRKVGIEMFISKGKITDTYKNYDAETHEWWYKSEYEIYDMSFMFDENHANANYAPFLKMTNQTTGIFHMEGVSPDCKTIGEALRERFSGRDFVISAIA